MMRVTAHAFLSIVAVVIAGACDHEGTTAGTAGRESSWLETNEIDLGMVTMGSLLQGQFVLLNRHPESRWISAVRSSCACQKMSLKVGNVVHGDPRRMKESVVVRAGEEVTLKFSVDPQEGMQEFSVTLWTDDATNQTVRCTARYTGIPFYQIQGPEFSNGVLSLEPIDVQDSASFRLRCRRSDGLSIEVEDGPYELPMGVTLRAEPSAGRKSWIVTGRVCPTGGAGGVIGGLIQVPTSNGPPIQFEIVAPVKPKIVSMPESVLYFGWRSKDSNEAKEWTVSLNGSGILPGATIQQSKAMGSVAEMEVQMLRPPSGRSVVIKVRPIIGSKTGRFSNNLSLQWDQANLPKQTVRCVGYVR